MRRRIVNPVEEIVGMTDDLRTRLRVQLEEMCKPLRAETERRRPDLRGKKANEIVAVLKRERELEKERDRK
jgi:hypothetical protein